MNPCLTHSHTIAADICTSTKSFKIRYFQNTMEWYVLLIYFSLMMAESLRMMIRMDMDQ